MNWIKAHKILSGSTIIVLILIIASASGGTKKQTAGNTSPVKAASATTKTAQPQPQVPSYSLVGTSGSVRVYTIDPTDNTEAKLTLIGKDLDSKYGSENLVRVSIFTDKTQAKIMADNPLAPADLEGDAAAAYDKAYVAQFNINKNTGLKEFEIHTQGLDGPSKQISL